MPNPDLTSPRPTSLRPLLLALAGVAVVGAAGAAWMERQEIRQAVAPAAVLPPKVASIAPSAPAAPRTQAAVPAQPTGPAKPTFDIVRISPQGTGVVAGRGVPGAVIIVRQGDHELGRATANANGEWVLVPEAPLPPGATELTLAERLPSGQQVAGEGTVVLVVPAPPTGTVQLPPAQQLAVEQTAAQHPAGQQPGAEQPVAQQSAGQQPAAAPPAMALLTTPNEPPRVLQAPAPPPGQAPVAAGPSPPLALGTMDYGQDGAMRFTGSAKPGTTVRVYVDGKPAGDAQAEANGAWTLTPPADMKPGIHQLRLDELNPTGEVISRTELPFQRANLDAAQIAPGNVIVQPGDCLWVIARHNYGTGIRYTAIFQANRTQIRDPNLIYPGQVFAIPGAEAPKGATPSSSSSSR